MEIGKEVTEYKKISTIVVFLTGVTMILFLASYLALGTEVLKIVIIRVISILYLIGFILILFLRKIFPSEVKVETGKKKRLKKFTGSNFRNIYHRRECRFADSIMDKYFEESDELSFFKNKKYKPCKLCKPDKHESVQLNDNLTQKAKVVVSSK